MDTFSTQIQHGAARPTQARRGLKRAGWPALVLCLTLAACGGGSDDSSSSPGTDPDLLGTCKLTNFQQSLLTRINNMRAAGANCGSEGVFAATTPVTWNPLLEQASDVLATDMATKNFFSHTGSNGSTLGSRVTATGYPWTTLGENIAAGQTTVDSVMDAWAASPGHCANLMNPNFNEVGVACELATSTTNTYSTYWVMDLGNRN